MAISLKGVGIGALGGLVSSLVVIALYIVATANAAGADAGDWLSFAGVVVGVAITILGTLSVDWFKRRAIEHRSIENMIIQLRRWESAAQAMGDDPMNGYLMHLRATHAYIEGITFTLPYDPVVHQNAHGFVFHGRDMLDRMSDALDEPNTERRNRAIRTALGIMQLHVDAIRERYPDVVPTSTSS